MFFKLIINHYNKKMLEKKKAAIGFFIEKYAQDLEDIEILEKKLYKEIDFYNPILQIAKSTLKRERNNTYRNYKIIAVLENKVRNCTRIIEKTNKELEKLNKKRQLIKSKISKIKNHDTYTIKR